jgi:endonuclease/exonuclease/phosphatase family metal-dependent hydrolase
MTEASTRHRRFLIPVAGALLSLVPALLTAAPEATAQPAARTAASAPTPVAGVRVMNFNILRASEDGVARDGGAISPWSKRRPKVAGLIRQSKAGVETEQEAGTLVSRYKRQVVDLVNELGSPYRLAYTEIPPREAGSTHIGIYVLYRSDLFRAPKHGDHFSLGHAKYAAWQVLVHRETGRKILFVSVHLSNGAGSSADQLRGDETRILVDKVQQLAHGNPVVIGGDFNSYPPRPAHNEYDSPGQILRAAGYVDGYNLAGKKVNSKYNTANHYLRRPPHADCGCLHVDHVWFSSSAAATVSLWKELLHLRNGEFIGVIPSDHNPIVEVAKIH